MLAREEGWSRGLVEGGRCTEREQGKGSPLSVGESEGQASLRNHHPKAILPPDSNNARAVNGGQRRSTLADHGLPKLASRPLQRLAPSCMTHRRQAPIRKYSLSLASVPVMSRPGHH